MTLAGLGQWTDGETLSKDDMVQRVDNNLARALVRDGMQLHVLAVPATTATWTVPSGWTLDYATSGVSGGLNWSGGSAVGPIVTNTGLYLWTVTANWPTAAASRRLAALYRNGALPPYNPGRDDSYVTATGAPASSSSGLTVFTAGDVASAAIYQDSGSTLTASSVVLSLARIA